MMADRPVVDDRDPADAIDDMVEHVMGLAGTWPLWDGRPCPVDDRIYTPHKAMRRVADHMVDHLAQLEAHLAGADPLPDRWRGSFVTTEMDMGRFSEEDVNEASNRLLRLAQLWRLRLTAIPVVDLDRAPGDAYSPREMAFCAAGSMYYAEAVGR
ncbi:MAG: hypothetical protein ACRDHI_01620 [Actinomycetota bacterium]